MNGRILCLALAVSLLLTGCGIGRSRRISVEPHEVFQGHVRENTVQAVNRQDLTEALMDMIASGTPEMVITLSGYPEELVRQDMEKAMAYAREDYALGAYGVEEIRYQMGTSGGKPAMAVSIDYLATKNQILRIRSVENVAGAEAAVLDALVGFDASVVLLVNNYIETDYFQLVEDYSLEHPESIMEIPWVSTGVYGSGSQRVVELTFTYDNSRDDLRNMQAQVAPVFEEAKNQVEGDASDRQKYSQLYSFLIDRFYNVFTLETSITPAYSLLCHGVGDSRAFATVYAAMCRDAGLESMVITGTHRGQTHSWNMIRIGWRYFHLDVLASRAGGRFRELTDEDMDGYVWDYSAYPASPKIDLSAGEETGAATEPEEEVMEPDPTESTEAVPPEEFPEDWPWWWLWPSDPTDPTEPPETTEATEETEGTEATEETVPPSESPEQTLPETTEALEQAVETAPEEGE